MKSFVCEDPDNAFVQVPHRGFGVNPFPLSSARRIAVNRASILFGFSRPSSIRAAVDRLLPGDDLAWKRSRHLATEADSRLFLCRIPTAAINAVELVIDLPLSVPVFPTEVDSQPAEHEHRRARWWSSCVSSRFPPLSKPAIRCGLLVQHGIRSKGSGSADCQNLPEREDE